MEATLHIGGLVTAGFDQSGRFLLTVSHDGRGVFDTSSWERVARDRNLAYPENGYAIGIGPISDLRIPVAERKDSAELEFRCPDGSLFYYSEGTVTIDPPKAEQGAAANP